VAYRNIRHTTNTLNLNINKKKYEIDVNLNKAQCYVIYMYTSKFCFTLEILKLRTAERVELFTSQALAQHLLLFDNVCTLYDSIECVTYFIALECH